MGLTTILAGCDLSGPGDQALERAIGIALRHQAKLVLVHAQASEPKGSEGGEVHSALFAQLGEVSAAIRAEEALRLADKLAELQRLGLRAAVISRLGRPTRCSPPPPTRSTPT